MSDTHSFLVIGFAFLAAGFVKGVVGMGLPAVAMPLLSLTMAPAFAAGMIVVPSMVTNIWQLVAGPSCLPLVGRLLTMMLGIAAGTVLTIGNLTGGEITTTIAALGLVLVIYGVIGISGLRFAVSPRTETWLSPIVGFVTGAISGSTGIFMVPAVPYLNSLGLDREQLIQALGLSFTVSTLSLGAALVLHGGYTALTLQNSALAVIPALAGMFVGQQFRGRLPPETFKRLFFLGVLVLGTYMCAKPYL